VEGTVKSKSDLGLLILRLALGGIMFVHGSQKLLGWFDGPGIAGFVGWMASMHVPAFAAWLAIIAEFFGGLGIILGLFTRLAALGIAFQMLVAIWMVHWKVGFFMNWGSVANRGEGWEYAFLILAAALALVMTGPGSWSLQGRRGGRNAARGPA
jgi:putative oxidoreductase